MVSSQERSRGPGLIYTLFQKREEKKKEKKSTEEKMLEFYREAHKKVKSTKDPGEGVRKALDFLGWDIPPEAVNSGAKLAAIYGLAIGIVIALVGLYLFYQDVLFFWEWEFGEYIEYASYVLTEPLFWVFILLPAIFYFGLYIVVTNFPVSLASSEANKELMPTLKAVGYIIMSMKLVPNLEKAVEFASEHSEGRIAKELKRIIWNTQLGIYATMEEAVDELAYKLGRFSEEFKHALMRIRTSVMEPDEAKRFILLDNALTEAMNGVKERLLSIASSLYMPSMQLFYLGIFLPLLLFIVLPVGAAFSEAPWGRTEYLILLYNIGLPIVVFSLASSIIGRRPPVYEMPEIPDRIIEGFEKKKKRAVLTSIGIFIIVLGTFYFLHFSLDWTKEKISIDYCGTETCLDMMGENVVQTVLSEYDTTPYMLIYGVLAAIVYSVAYYLYIINSEREKKQKEIMEMEGEFKDAVYLLASRMGEGKPLESALESIKYMMPEAKIRKLFEKVAYNIKILGMSLHDAVFDKTFGALKDVPSKVLNDSMKVLISAVSLGTELAAKALVSLSEQLRNEESVVKSMREKMSEIATMMEAMAFMVAPIVLGITVALEDVIVDALSGLKGPEQEIPSEVAQQLGMGVPEIKNISGNIAPTWAFLIVVGVYVVEIVALLTYFSVYMLDGKNRIGLMKKLGIALSVGITLFIISSYMSMSLVAGLLR